MHAYTDGVRNRNTMNRLIEASKNTSPVTLAEKPKVRLKDDSPTYDVGVIVGRFQVHALHQGHRDLIEFVSERHDKVLIVLGCSVLWSTKNNPLDRGARSQMILAEFPNVHLAYIKDHPDDRVWSQHLDGIVSDHTGPAQNAVLYGSRDSFVDRYHGKLPTQVLESDVVMSGSEVRKMVGTSATRQSEDFRAGVVYATQQRYDSGFPAVDVVIHDGDDDRLSPIGNILLGRKPNETKYRFIGGFFDPSKDGSMEDTARREGTEETGLELNVPRYLGSFKVDDWRYRGESDKIVSSVFYASRCYGSAQPNDDIAEVRWFSREDLQRRDVVPEHHPIIDMLEREGIL